MLSSTQIANFERDGFLVVNGVIAQQNINNLRMCFERRVDDLISRYRHLLKMPSTLGKTFDEKLTILLQHAPAAYEHLDISLPLTNKMGARVPDWQEVFGDEWHNNAGIFASDAIFNLVTHPNIIAIGRQLLGDNVALNPVQHVRIKPPQRLLSGASVQDANVSRTLWHQDEAVITQDARDTNILTVWVAISDATTHNGCMYAVAGSHRENNRPSSADYGLETHCPGKTLAAEIYIPDESIDQSRLRNLEARSGDVVLLHQRTIHGAGENKSNKLRWSFDLRYQPVGYESGRSCFPLFTVTGENAVDNAEHYHRAWLNARDDIINGNTEALFNDRWEKHREAPICA